MIDDNVIGFIHSRNLIKKGKITSGCAMYITKDKIIGATKVKMGTVAAYLGEGANADIKFWEEAKKVKQLVETRKSFEVLGNVITSIEIKKPGVFRRGFITLKVKNKELGIILGTEMDDKEYTILLTLISSFAPGKIKMVE